MSEAALFDSLAAEFGGSAKTTAADNRLAENIRASLFPKQANLLVDASRRKAVICPRRAGKSWSALSCAYYTCLTKPWSNCMIIGLTLKSLKGIYWERVLPVFERTFGIQTNKHHTEMKIRFANGSLITFAGAETRAEIEKLRGPSYDWVVIDEGASFSPAVLDELVGDVFRRALMDRKGTIMLIGTPGHVLEGSFYHGTYPGALDHKDVPYSRTYDDPEPFWTRNKSNRTWRWSRHSWSVKENVALPHAWEESLADKEMEGWSDDHPTWRREYLGEWVSGSDIYVYAYPGLLKEKADSVQWTPSSRSKENPSGLPDGHEWRFVAGLDLGFEDDFAMFIGAYSLTKGELYHVLDIKQPHLDVYQVADLIESTLKRFDNKVDAIVADSVGLGKMVVETLNRRHGMNIIPAEKREKFDHIELVNADFHSGKIKIIPDSDLDLELRTLQWDLRKSSKTDLARAGKLREHPSLPNHLCDALLYAWRYSHHYWANPVVKRHQVGTTQWFEDWEERSLELLNKRDDEMGDELTRNLRNRSVDILGGHYERYGK